MNVPVDELSPLDADGIFFKGWYLKYIFDLVSPEAQRVSRDWFYFYFAPPLTAPAPSPTERIHY